MAGFLENQATLLVLPVTVVALCVWPRSLTAARRVGWFVVAWLTLRFGLPLVFPPYELRTCGMKLAQWISLALPPAAVLWALYDRTVRRNPDYMILRLTRWLLAGLAVGSLLGALPLRLSSMLSSGPASVSWQDICTVILGQCLTVLYIYGAWTALKPPAKLAARRIRVIAYVGSAIVFIITALALGTFDNTISQGMPWMRMVYGIAVIGYMIKTVGIFAVVYWHWHPLAIGRATVLGDRRQAICQLCGYDLTGNVTGICPECGTRVSAPPRAAQRS